MTRTPSRLALAAILGLAACTAVHAASTTTYIIDPSHTYPSFEADHMGGVSLWRGKFNSSSGTVILDRAAGTGSVDIVIDTASIDFGHDAMNEHARAADYFDTDKHPKARYAGKLVDFVDGKPTRVAGALTIRGTTRPVDLKINRFKCIPHPLHKRELCGADAFATIQRDDFGISAGKDWGFDMAVTLRIQVEAVAEE